MTTTVCIIPARGGSKRIPGKNYRLLAGKPLISYVIEAAKSSRCFSDIVVSSDHDEILKIASNAGVSTDRRRAELAEDRVQAVEVIADYLARLDKGKYDTVACMLPTCPFCTTEDVVRANQMFVEGPSNHTVISVTEFGHPPQFGFSLTGDSQLEMREPEIFSQTNRSQSVSKVYHANGGIRISPVKKYMKFRTFYTSPMKAYIMPLERSFDIDCPSQLEIADIMMRKILAEQ